MTVERALDGIVVTELGGREGVAICGSLLAQLGATVIVAEPADADATPRMRDRHRRYYTAGKLSVSVSSLAKEDQDLLRWLAGRSDIVLTSSDIDAAVFRFDMENPDNVVCDLTAFGSSGPLAGEPFSDLQVQALSGIVDSTGQPDGPPVPIGVPIVSYLSGTYAASAALAALRVKRLQGFGQSVEVAMFDAAFVTLNPFLSSVLTNKSANRTRMGNRHPTVAPWNLFESSDGWVLICAGSQGQWERLCSLMNRPDVARRFNTQASRIAGIQEVDEAIETWTRTLTTADCVEKLAAVGVASGPIAAIEQFPREANLEFRKMIRRLHDPAAGRDVFIAASPLVLHGSPAKSPETIPSLGADRAEVERIAAALEHKPSPARTKTLERPLAGVRVVEIGQYTTAPLCARHLAHLGAEVIKVEQPGGDESRTWVPHIGSHSVSFRLNNADKRSLVLNLRSASGADALKSLLGTADVLVENTKPGTLAKFGLSPSQIREANPRLVYCAISGFGAQSLYAARPAFDMVIQAMSGFMTALRPDGIPLKSGISTADTMGAEMAMVAIVGALEYRDRTGRGQYIDLSMQDISCWLTETAWNGDPASRPIVLAGSDGFVLVEASEAELRKVLTTSRGPGREELAQQSRTEIALLINRLGLAAAPVNSIRESSELPQTHERRLWYTMSENGQDWPMLSSPLRLRLTPPQVSHLAPDVNQDGDAILSELGLTVEELLSMLSTSFS